MSDEVKNNPVIRISIAGTVGDKCQISFETYADAAAPADFISATVDKLMFVRDRQVAKYDLKDLKALVETETVQLEALKQDLQRVDARHSAAAEKAMAKGMRVTHGLTDKDKTERYNVVANIEARTKRLEMLRARIAENEKLVGELK